jgi:regulation of enolase protein 1 (concanavalin A-like superfamily)
MRTLIDDGHGLVLRTIRQLVAATRDDPAGPPAIVIEEIASVDWASLTFAGRLHRFELRIEGGREAVEAACAALEAALPDAEIAASGHLLAQAGVIACAPARAELAAWARRCVVEALTLETD